MAERGGVQAERWGRIVSVRQSRQSDRPLRGPQAQPGPRAEPHRRGRRLCDGHARPVPRQREPQPVTRHRRPQVQGARKPCLPPPGGTFLRQASRNTSAPRAPWVPSVPAPGNPPAPPLKPRPGRGAWPLGWRSGTGAAPLAGAGRTLGRFCRAWSVAPGGAGVSQQCGASRDGRLSIPCPASALRAVS